MTPSKLICGDHNVNVPAHLNFGKYILNQLRSCGNKVAIEYFDTNEKITCKELAENAVKISIALTKLGLRKGDVVAVCSEPVILFIPTTLAIILSGAVFVCIDAGNGKYHIGHKISIAQPKFCITSNQFWKDYSDTIKSFDFIKTIIPFEESIEFCHSIASITSTVDSDIDSFEPVTVAGQVDLAVITFSSGTTGMPKGVEITHLNAIIYSLPYDFVNESVKVGLLFGDWYHLNDLFVLFRMVMLGTKVVYTLDWSPENLIKAISMTRTNIVFLESARLGILAKTEKQPNENLKCLKYMFVSASPFHPTTADMFKKRFPSVENILQGYGSSETHFITSQTYHDKKLGSVGQVCPCITIKVVDTETREHLGPNQEGEICVKGPALMKGYTGIKPETYHDPQGFFKTGDLGYYDEEGYFYIVGRLKEIIDCDGYKVAPMELENIILLHPGVKEVAVVGKKDKDFGEVPYAFIVRKTSSTVTEQEIIDFVAPEVATYMQLRGGVTFLTELPRNNGRKIFRRRLREMLQS